MIMQRNLQALADEMEGAGLFVSHKVHSIQIELMSYNLTCVDDGTWKIEARGPKKARGK